MPTYHIWRHTGGGDMEKIGDFVEGTRLEVAIRAKETELGTTPQEMDNRIYFGHETTTESPGVLLKGRISNVRFDPVE